MLKVLFLDIWFYALFPSSFYVLVTYFFTVSFLSAFFDRLFSLFYIFFLTCYCHYLLIKFCFIVHIFELEISLHRLTTCLINCFELVNPGLPGRYHSL